MRKHIVNLEKLKPFNVPVCACIGYFDGMHLGHQKLITETVRLAKQKNCESALITFDPDPWVAIKGAQDIRHISTMRQRMNRAIALGIQNIIILNFTREMSLLEPQQFVDIILSSINLKGLICGFDFHYGYMGKGNCDTLRDSISYDLTVIDAVTDEKGKISSTRISEAIVHGRMEEAHKMLGYPYQIEGIVMHGNHQGTSMGFPTINLDFSEEYLLPKTGVYAGYVEVARKPYRAMINVGHNPTFNFRNDISVEAHVFNFSDMLYGRHVTFDFLKYMREERQFRSKNNLILQLEQDAFSIKKVLLNYERSISE